jgi:uncharacterized protein YegL
MTAPNTASNNLTEIAFILDQSGSMGSIKSGTLEGVNAFLDQQKRENATYPVRFSLTLFSTSIEIRNTSLSVTEVPALTEENYQPNGGTALLDAIGLTIDSLGKRLAETPKPDRPAKVIVAIMTDGEENSSRQFTWTQISDKIKHQSEVYKWEFLFMGANQDAIATASRISIDRDSGVNYFQQDGSARKVLRAMSASVQYSKRAPRPQWSKPSLQEIMAEEEARDQSKQ